MSASFFKNWVEFVPPGLEICPVQLPGREERARETWNGSTSALCAELGNQVASEASDVPFTFFGHSLGGRLAFETASCLESRGRAAPRAVFLAATSDPGTLTAEDRRCHLMESAEFELYAAQFSRFPEDLRRYPRQFQWVLTLLRADFALFATASELPDVSIGCPLVVYGGSADPKVTPSHLEPWRLRSTRFEGRRTVRGDHFFPTSDNDDFKVKFALELQKLLEI